MLEDDKSSNGRPLHQFLKKCIINRYDMSKKMRMIHHMIAELHISNNYLHNKICQFIQNILMKYPQTFRDLLDNSQSLRYQFMRLIQYFQLVKYIPKNKLQNLQIFHLARFLYQLLH